MIVPDPPEESCRSCGAPGAKDRIAWEDFKDRPEEAAKLHPMILCDSCFDDMRTILGTLQAAGPDGVDEEQVAKALTLSWERRAIASRRRRRET